MREIDAVLADEICVPPDAVSAFTERVVYLPDTRLCFSPPPDAPPIAPAPSLGGKPITFGCFQNLAKVNDAVLDVWRRIFERLPSARLRVQSADLGSASSRDRFVGRLRAAGIDVDRVDLHGPTERLAYLSCHAEVDAVLDTFPFPGGTTTCEALWMGVPTITLCGDSMISRQGAALMHAARLPQFVCANLDAYVERALAIADDPCLRARLQFRERLATAPLFDAPRFARQFVDTVEALFEASLNTVG
jgi:predicted O-linked N-acetylglucosamine transferase (SPINDLY family)